ncbi:hypothetical protein L3Y34_012194 [Caenorhabditis briggsae]|uniref:Uncharacterized protein n=1 Tax=Caenorhabditis briggsae TaxID=6238 RepID=A0AAE8ZTN7_CAEBR|nr:hypothetical protein L3Y34_012194 [Caenorhabditis briggsae]
MLRDGSAAKHFATKRAGALKPDRGARFKTFPFAREQSTGSSGDNGDNPMFHRGFNSSPLPSEEFHPDVDNLGIVYPADSSSSSPLPISFYTNCSTRVCTPIPVDDNLVVNPAGSSSLSPTINSNTPNTPNPDVDNSGIVNPPNANVEIPPPMLPLSGGNSYGRPNIFQIFNNRMRLPRNTPGIKLDNLRLMLAPPGLNNCQNIFRIFSTRMGFPRRLVDGGAFSHSPNSLFVLVNPPLPANIEENPISEGYTVL